MRALLLRSPLHRLVSSSWLLLTLDGHTEVLRYQADGDRVTVLGPGEESWWRALSADQPTPVRVRLHGQEREGTARLAAGEALDEAMIAYLHAHPDAWQTLGVPPDASAGDVAEAAGSQAVILIELT